MNTSRNPHKKKNQANSSTWAKVAELFVAKSFSLLFTIVNKGTALPLAAAILVIIASLRMPADSLAEVVKTIVEPSTAVGVLGWGLAFVILFVMYGVTKWQRSIFTQEIQRLSEERNQLQDQLNIRIGSSNRND